MAAHTFEAPRLRVVPRPGRRGHRRAIGAVGLHAVAVVALVGLGSPAHAADVDRFEPAGSNAFARGTLQGESPWLGNEGWAGGLYGSFAQDPVVRQFEDGREISEVAAMLPLTFYGAYTYAGRARFEAFLPIYAWVDAPITGYRNAALGDMRFQANVPVYESGDLFRLSVVPRLGLPSGSRDALIRQGVTGTLTAAAAGEIPDSRVGWVANLGITGSPGQDVDGVGIGSSFDLLGGGYWRATDAFRIGAELDLRAGLVQDEAGGTTTSTAHLFAQNVLPSGLGMTLGAGTGLVGGIGAPEYRAFAAVTYADLVPDRDGDGLADAVDACVGDAEDFDGFEDTDGCPDPDNDGDGIGDYMDQCDAEIEDLDGFEDSDGCPDPDNDGDSVADVDDLCPDTPGSPAASGCSDADADGVVDNEDLCPGERGTPEALGCADADGDAVADYRDTCPAEAAPEGEDPRLSDGCPKRVWLTADRIRLGERVDFLTTGAVLRPFSKPILDEVAALMQAYPQLLEVEVQVHLDDTAEEEAALDLTQRRAEAVVAYLGTAGVSPTRLAAKGYGKTRPVDTNRTEAGRYNNRRVELHILRQEAIPKPDIAPPGPAVSRPAPGVEGAPAGEAPSPWGPVPDAPSQESPQEAQVAPAPAAPGASEAPSPWGPVAPAPATPAGPPGLLSITIEGGGWANVYLDGQRLTRGAPFSDFEVPAGTHELRISNDRLRLDHRETIEVKSGAPLSLVIPVSEQRTVTPKESEAPSIWGPQPGAEGDAEEPKKPEAFDGSFPIWGPTEEPEPVEAPERVEEPEPEDDGGKRKRPPRGSKKR